MSEWQTSNETPKKTGWYLTIMRHVEYAGAKFALELTEWMEPQHFVPREGDVCQQGNGWCYDPAKFVGVHVWSEVPPHADMPEHWLLRGKTAEEANRVAQEMRDSW